MHNFTVDYLTFSLKPDKLSPNRRDITLEEIIALLGLWPEWDNFKMIGGRNGYPTCYSYNNILIHEPAPERYADMGFCVMMKGEGLRWLASLTSAFNIYSFLCLVRSQVDSGLSLNISRIDLALDDKPAYGDGILDMNVIYKKAKNQEYISPARKMRQITHDVSYKGDTLTGETIYFGSRSSQSFVRIYDKAAEQGVSGHWVRVEFEFKQDTAMRIVNAMCELGENFPKEFPKMANRYLRFIEMDDSNRSRCSVSDFWERFMGTVATMKLSILPYKKQTLSRLFKHFMLSWTPSLATLFEAFPIEWLVDMVLRHGGKRMKDRHWEMLKRPDDTSLYYSSADKWDLEMPKALNQLRLSV